MRADGHARIVPGNAGLMHARAWCLSDDQDASGCGGTQHRTRAKRQVRFTYTASAHREQQILQ